MGRLQAADEGMLFWFGNHHGPRMNPIMLGFTQLGQPPTLISVVAAAVLLLALARRLRTALILLLAALLGLGIDRAVKYLVHRERPDVAWRLIDRPQEPSFPSGHAMNSMTIYGSLALLASRRLARRAVRALVLVAGFTLPLLIGISRPYLGVHYPSDVLAGWTAGLACALLALWVDQRWGERERVSPFPGPP